RSARAARPEKTVGELLSNGEVRAYAVYQSAAKIGFSLSRRMRQDDGWLFVDQELYRLVVQESRHQVRVESQCYLADDFSLRSFRTFFADGMTRLEAEGHVEGSELILAMKSAGRTFEERRPLDGP